MEDTEPYYVKGKSKPPKLEKTIIYAESEELDKLRKHVGPFNQKTKEGGVSGKIRELVKLYNSDPAGIEKMISEYKDICNILARAGKDSWRDISVGDKVLYINIFGEWFKGIVDTIEPDFKGSMWLNLNMKNDDTEKNLKQVVRDMCIKIG